MITETIINVFLTIIHTLVMELPSALFSLPNWLVQFLKLLSTGLKFFPTDVWIVVTANIYVWWNFQMGWAIFEWLYKKIPGVN